MSNQRLSPRPLGNRGRAGDGRPRGIVVPGYGNQGATRVEPLGEVPLGAGLDASLSVPVAEDP